MATEVLAKAGRRGTNMQVMLHETAALLDVHNLDGVGLWLKGCRQALQGPPDVSGYLTLEQLCGLAEEMQRTWKAQLPKPEQLG